ncbi:protein adenylyltransferase SelO [uncultured Salinisphaera sp.]|uniref:protein adenylyltransferase SelO n=1 Tax=uncultured Salinisphaera sp. TaxID=359372 RepID=UPI0032B2DE9D|tara:strand:+ start:43846 stop:45375 length:1530 start_codon:yes stop_codon:yes gene_type:complete
MSDNDTVPRTDGQHPLDQLNWVNAGPALGVPYYSPQPPSLILDPYPVALNDDVAELIGLDSAALRAAGYAEIFSGNCLPHDAEPVSHRYGGHQFGVWAGQLGDGRAITLGDICRDDGQAFDIQLKGAGQTPYSRFADGRAVLRSTIREYLASEALANLGIPTTRALAIVGSDAPVRRETIETAAILTRVAPSLVRFGSFEMLFYDRSFEQLAPLADAVIEAHHPEIAAISDPHARYRAWVVEVIERTAALIADWQAVGFCHGVLNTDNMSVLGLTLDYGPFGFMDSFQPDWVCNHTDVGARYAYNQQPQVGLWNLGRFVQAILPLLADEPDDAVEIGQELLETYRGIYDAAYLARIRAKLGLATAGDDDLALAESLFQVMAANGADFTRTFRGLCHVGQAPGDNEAPFLDEFVDRDAAAAWLATWRTRLADESRDDAARRAAMCAVNPKYILRNYLAQNAIEQAQAGDYSELARLHEILKHPFDEQPESADYARLPPDWARGLVLSCSA